MGYRDGGPPFPPLLYWMSYGSLNLHILWRVWKNPCTPLIPRTPHELKGKNLCPPWISNPRHISIDSEWSLMVFWRERRFTWEKNHVIKVGEPPPLIWVTKIIACLIGFIPHLLFLTSPLVNETGQFISDLGSGGNLSEGVNHFLKTRQSEMHCKFNPWKEHW